MSLLSSFWRITLLSSSWPLISERRGAMSMPLNSSKFHSVLNLKFLIKEEFISLNRLGMINTKNILV